MTGKIFPKEGRVVYSKKKRPKMKARHFLKEKTMPTAKIAEKKKTGSRLRLLAFGVLFLGLSTTIASGLAQAEPSERADANAEDKLQRCLRQSENSPDEAKALAESWIRDGGGDRAKLCRAFSRYYARDYIFAAQDFAVLAKRRAATNKKHAAGLYAQAGDAYHKARDFKSAETAYGLALDLESQDPEIWRDRGLARAADERFWDAIEDFTKALAIMPDMPETLRARAQAWIRLGLESNARSDLLAANKIEPNDEAQKISP